MVISAFLGRGTEAQRPHSKWPGWVVIGPWRTKAYTAPLLHDEDGGECAAVSPW